MNKRPFPYRTSLALAGVALAALGAPSSAAAQSSHSHATTKAWAASGTRAQVAQPPAGIEKAARQLFLSIGEGEIINLPAGVTSVWVSNTDAADVYVNNNHQIHLFGKAFGAATVFATAAGGAVVYSANIMVAQNSTSLDPMLKAAFPSADIHVMMAGQMAVLTGTVASPLESQQVESLIKSALNPGTKAGSEEALKVMVINRLKTATPLQVHLRVRIAEVSRSWARQVGTNLASSMSSNGFQYGIGQGSFLNNTSNFTTGALGVGVTPNVYVPNPMNVTPTNPQGLTQMPGISITPPSTATTLASAFKLGPLSIIGALDLGEQVGLVNTLAEPDLTALSGETADFLAGGEFPIPVSSGLGAVSVEFKSYGVSLSFTPTVLANGNIALHVRPEVSELDTSRAVTLNGISVPGLTTRHAETTLEMGSGQSMMLAGLLSNNATHTIQQLPGAGDIPVLGNLFKSTNFQKGETELVIVVTPYLVNPVNDGDIKLPTDALNNPNEVQRLMGNMLTDGKTGGVRPGPTSADAPATPPANASASGGKPKHAAANDSQAQPGFSLN